ncbi:MAG: hypothetical protein JWM71_441 [Solirubrobacteraceae bacterium]|nr:hypothetical protein [Solirubrobacteraceae bacterium]
MPQPQPFTMRTIADSDRSVRIVVEGEIDMATAPELTNALAAEMTAHRSVLLDLRGVGFMDSTGVGVLINAINDAKVNGWNLGVTAGLTPPVRRVLELTGTLAMVPFVED